MRGNPKLSSWCDQILMPAMLKYFEKHPKLRRASVIMRTDLKPLPLVVVGAVDEKDPEWIDVKQEIKLALGSAPSDVDLLVETSRLRELSAAVYNSDQAVDEDASAIHESE